MVSRSAIGPKGRSSSRQRHRGLFGSSAIHWQVLVRPRQNKQSNTIAHELGISVGGVEIHIRRVLTNLGARDRAESAFVAVRIGQSWLNWQSPSNKPRHL